MPFSRSQGRLQANSPSTGNVFNQSGWYIRTGGVSTAIIASAADINKLADVTASATDINKLTTMIASAADLNQLSSADALIGTANTGVNTTPEGTLEVTIGGVSTYLMTRSSLA